MHDVMRPSSPTADVPDFEGRGETEPVPHFYQNWAEAEYLVTVYQYMRLRGYPAGQQSDAMGPGYLWQAAYGQVVIKLNPAFCLQEAPVQVRNLCCAPGSCVSAECLSTVCRCIGPPKKWSCRGASSCYMLQAEAPRAKFQSSLAGFHLVFP